MCLYFKELRRQIRIFFYKKDQEEFGKTFYVRKSL